MLKKRVKKAKKRILKLRSKIIDLREVNKILNSLIHPVAGKLEVRMYEYYNNRKRGHFNSGWMIEAYIKYRGKMLINLGLNKIENGLARPQVMSTNPLKLYVIFQRLAERLNLKMVDGGYYVNYPKKGPILMK